MVSTAAPTRGREVVARRGGGEGGVACFADLKRLSAASAAISWGVRPRVAPPPRVVERTLPGHGRFIPARLNSAATTSAAAAAAYHRLHRRARQDGPRRPMVTINVRFAPLAKRGVRKVDAVAPLHAAVYQMKVLAAFVAHVEFFARSQRRGNEGFQLLMILLTEF